MRLVYLFLFLLYFLQAYPDVPGTKGWQELTISDGLSQGMIFDLKQDQKGFIWIATKDGLNRYDGFNFRVFKHDPYNPFSISSNISTALLVDRHQRIWVGTQNHGLNLFDPQTERFYHIAINENSVQNRKTYGIRQLVEDPDGNVWISTESDQLIKVELLPALKNRFPEQADITGQVRLTVVPVEAKNGNINTNILTFRPDGQLYVWTPNGIFVTNWKRPVASRKQENFAMPGDRIMAVYTDPALQYWFIVSQTRIIAYHNRQWRSIPLAGRQSIRSHIKPVHDRKLAVITTNHLWVMSPDELFRQDSLGSRNAYTSLPQNSFGVSGLIQDITGNFWVGTMGYGLRKFNPSVRKFHSYLPNQSLSNILIDRQHRVYLRLYYGYALFDRQQQRLLPYVNQHLSATERPQRIAIQDRYGFFWSCNTEGGRQRLIRYSADWTVIRQYPLPAGVTLGDYGNQALEDSAGMIWIGAGNGNLLKFNPPTGAFQVFNYGALLRKTGTAGDVYALLPEGRNLLWIGTQEGLIRVNGLLTKPAFSVFRNSVQNRQSLSEDYVLSLCNDPDKPDRYIWVGTKGGGLDRLDKRTGHFIHFTEKQGLPNEVVYGILPDEAGNLWLSTNRGIAVFNTGTHRFRNFTKADGLQDDEFNNQSYLKLATGEMLFGGINGLTLFKPADVSVGRHRKPIAAIISLKVNNQPVAVNNTDNILTKGITYAPALELTHDQNMITLEFGVMDFTNVGKNRYRYQLRGIDRNRVEAGTNRFANYAQLPDGHYTLQMEGSADGEVWSDPVLLQIRVHPPVYRTWWAYLFYGLVLVIVIWQVYRVQTQRFLLQQQIVYEQKEAQRLAELDNLKTHFFANISHEFRTPLTLILGPLAGRQQRMVGETELSMMERNARRLMNLINQLLDLSKLDSHELKPVNSPGDLAALFQVLASSFTSLAESRSIRFRFEQNQARYPAGFDPDKFEKITTNLLSNAFKFTPDGQQVVMQVTFAEDQCTLLVDDTGIGIPDRDLPHIFDRFYQRSTGEPVNRSYGGSGIGLALVNELVKLLGGTISVKSKEGFGTSVQVSLPVVKLTGTAPDQPEFTPPVLAQPVQEVAGALLPSEAARPVPSPANRPVLLLIDDNADIRAYLRRICGDEYMLVEAEDGQQGLERATETTPDLVICDLMMPRLDGFGFCRIMKMQESTSHIPIVMLTAKATTQDRIEGFELGADDYLTKPFGGDELLVRVRNLLAKQERLRLFFGTQPVSTPLIAPVTGSAPVFSREAVFLQKARQVLDQHYAGSAFGVEEFSQAMNLSTSQLLRKLKALTNLTATEYLRQYRLEQAARLLATRTGTISEIAYQVGFESLPYFTKVFQEQYGVLPSEYTAT